MSELDKPRALELDKTMELYETFVKDPDRLRTYVPFLYNREERLTAQQLLNLIDIKPELLSEFEFLVWLKHIIYGMKDENFCVSLICGLLQRGYNPSSCFGFDLYSKAVYGFVSLEALDQLLSEWPILYDKITLRETFIRWNSPSKGHKKRGIKRQILKIYLKYIDRSVFQTSAMNWWLENNADLFLETQLIIPPGFVKKIPTDHKTNFLRFMKPYSQVRVGLAQVGQDQKGQKLWFCKDLVEVIASYVITRKNETKACNIVNYNS